jgi:F0F1-type ATP synthase, subunit a
MEHELWVTALFNDAFAGIGNGILNAIGRPAADHAHPWSNWMVMQLVVVVGMLLFFGWLKSRLSVDRPGKVQHCFEIVYTFLKAQADEVVGDTSKRYMAFFGAIFFFVLFMNLIGLIPSLESPTMFPVVTCGLAVVTFFYYHAMGLKANGLGGYFKQFMGPVLILAPIMVPIEMVSHLARPLSLTIRLYANMFAGEQITDTFLKLTHLIVPAVFMGLHVFVSFLQAYIFALLAMVYVGGAVAHEH